MSSSPPSPAKFTALRRHAPFLNGYLDRLESSATWKSKFLAFAIVGVVGVVGVLASAVLVAAGQLGPGGLLWVLTNVFGGLLVSGVGGALWLRSRRPDPLPDHVMLETRTVASRLRSSLTQNRLHRELHPAAIELLEEAARSWQRIHDTTGGSFWTSPDLAAHYQSVRKSARSSADQAMTEILLHMRSAIKPVGQPQTLVEGLQTVLDAIGIPVNTGANTEPLPDGYVPAAIVARSLSDLATEIEQTSIRAIATSTAVPDSSQGIRKTLEELRQIREAETELEDDLKVT